MPVKAFVDSFSSNERSHYTSRFPQINFLFITALLSTPEMQITVRDSKPFSATFLYCVFHLVLSPKGTKIILYIITIEGII